MYIIQHAFKSISRNKARNILIGIIVFIIAVASCVSLSIRESASVAKEDTLSSLSITAQISFDRTAAMEKMQESAGSDTTAEGGKGFDKSMLQGSSLTLDEYLAYTEAQSEGDSYYYQTSASLNTSGDLLAYSSTEDTSSDESTSETDESAPDAGMPSDAKSDEMMGGGRGSFMSQGDFSLTGFSSYDSMLSLFGEDGTCSITEGEMFDVDSDELDCVISDELAMYNSLSVGDTITLSNPSNEEETYTFTISGIYTNTASSEGNNAFAATDPANNIYLSYNALNSVIESSAEQAVTVTDDAGNETTSELTNQLSFTYSFANVDNYNTFADSVHDLGLSDEYTVSSSDLSAYENSLAPLETLSSMAGWFFIIVLFVGGVILVVLNIFNLRERKYEIGVLTAIGMKKWKVSAQFVCEIFTVTFIALVLGTALGAGISVPVTNTLLASQIESSEASSETLNENFGFTKNGDSNSAQMGGRMGNMTTPGMPGSSSSSVSIVDSVSSATNLVVILQLLLIGFLLTIISSLAALITIMRYEPLKILSNRA